MANQYPVISAGQRITASLLNAMIPVIIRKASNTVATSDATLSDDPELTATLGANSVYFVEFYVKYDTTDSSSTNAGIRTAWTVPSGASGTRSALGAGSTQTTDDPITGHAGIHGFSTAVQYGRRSGGNQLYLYETAVVNTTNSGTCAFQWAQWTSSTASVTVHADSFMRYRQIA